MYREVLNNKRLLIVIGVLIIGVILTVALALRQQEVRSHASGELTSLELDPSQVSKHPGESFDVKIYLHARGYSITGFSTSIKVQDPTHQNNDMVGQPTFVKSENFDTEVKNIYSPDSGMLEISMVNVSNGTSSDQDRIEIGTISFPALNSGAVQVSFDSTEVVAQGHPEDLSINQAPQNLYTIQSGFHPTPTLTLSPSPTLSPTPSVGIVPATDAYQEFSGVLSVEAEDYPRGGRISRSDILGNIHSWSPNEARDTTASKNHYVVTANKDQVFDPGKGAQINYPVNFRNSGTYKIWIRGWAPSSSGNSAFVGLDNKTPTKALVINRNDAWTWSNTAQDATPLTITVKKGQHILNLWERKDGLRVDKIVLQKSNTPPVEPFGPLESAFGSF